MNSHELCPSCKPYGKCVFREIAESVAGSVPSVEFQTPMKPGEKISIETFDAHQTISMLRTEARERLCPNVNSIDPYYEGKENL